MVRVSSPAELRPWSEFTAKMVMGVVPGLVPYPCSVTLFRASPIVTAIPLWPSKRALSQQGGSAKRVCRTLLMCLRTKFGVSGHMEYCTRFRGRKRHINTWHMNNFSVSPVTDPPGRVPESSRPGTRTKNFYVPWFPHTAHKLLTPGHRSGDPWPPGRETPPPPGRHRRNLFMFMRLFLS